MSSFTSIFKRGAGRAVLHIAFTALCFLACDRLLFFLMKGGETRFNHAVAASVVQNEWPPHYFSTLIIGSSRTQRGIHPLYFWEELRQRAYREAKGNKRAKYDYYFYQHFRAAHGKPRVVIYGVDYFMFKIGSDERAMLQLRQGQSAAAPSPHAAGLSLLWANKPRFDQFLNDALNHVDNRLEPPRHPGEGAIQPLIDTFIGFSPRQRQNLVMEKPLDFRGLPYQPYPGLEGEYLKKLLEMLHQDGVTALLVMPPEYIGTYETNFEREKFVRDIQALIRPFPKAHFLNYNDPHRFPLDNPEYFQDGGYGREDSHLSSVGGVMFNRMLLHDIRRYYH